MHQRTAVGVGQDQTNLLGSHYAQHIEQVADVKADLEGATVIFNADFFFRLFLFRVVSLDLQLTIRQLQADTAVLLVGQNRGAAERFAERLAVTEYQLVAAFG